VPSPGKTGHQADANGIRLSRERQAAAVSAMVPSRRPLRRSGAGWGIRPAQSIHRAARGPARGEIGRGGEAHLVMWQKRRLLPMVSASPARCTSLHTPRTPTPEPDGSEARPGRYRERRFPPLAASPPAGPPVR